MTQQIDNIEEASMINIATLQISELVKRANNVIGLFPGMAAGPYKRKTSTSLTVIAARQILTGCIESLEAVGIDLIVSDEALAEIAKKGIDAKFGAKPLQKIIEMEIELPISRALRNGQFISGDTIKVYWSDGALVFTNRIDKRNEKKVRA